MISTITAILWYPVSPRLISVCQTASPYLPSKGLGFEKITTRPTSTNRHLSFHQYPVPLLYKVVTESVPACGDVCVAHFFRVVSLED